MTTTYARPCELLSVGAIVNCLEPLLSLSVYLQKMTITSHSSKASERTHVFIATLHAEQAWEPTV